MTKSGQYPKAARKQALRLHKGGWGYKRIADVIECFPSTIKKWVEAAGQEKHPSPKYPKRKREMAVGHYADNDVSIAATAKKFDVHPRTLARWLREENVEIKSKLISRKDVLADISAGMTKREIAEKYACSESWVYKIQSDG